MYPSETIYGKTEYGCSTLGDPCYKSFSITDKKIEVGQSGNDFERKLGYNDPAMEQIIKQSIDENSKVSKIKQGEGTWALADFYANINIDGKKSTIDL